MEIDIIHKLWIQSLKMNHEDLPFKIWLNDIKNTIVDYSCLVVIDSRRLGDRDFILYWKFLLYTDNLIKVYTSLINGIEAEEGDGLETCLGHPRLRSSSEFEDLIRVRCAMVIGKLKLSNFDRIDSFVRGYGENDKRVFRDYSMLPIYPLYDVDDCVIFNSKLFNIIKFTRF